MLPGERVACCCRVPHGQAVSVCYSDAMERAYYAGLQTCGSVWACPVCAARIAERRREEIGLAVQRWLAAGGRVLLVTFTVRHHCGERLGVVLDQVLGAHRAMKQGRAWRRLVDEVGLHGTIRALEVTYGLHGWHPHIHELWFIEPGSVLDADEVASAVQGRWAAMVDRVGGSVVAEHGAQVVEGRGDAAAVLRAYVTKLGTWDLPSEMARSVTKQARGAVGLTPTALLAEYCDGDLAAGELWREYALTFKGKNHLVWSRGLRAELLADVEELTDEEAAAQEEQDGRELVRMTPQVWAAVCAGGWRAGLLDVAEAGGAEAVLVVLESLGGEVVEAGET